MNIPGVKTATKTGTSDKDGKAKDIWMMSYSPALAMGVWFGNPDTTILKNGNSTLPGPIIQAVMEYAHKTVYAGDGRWKSGDWFTQPAGIQKVGKELYPAWWNKTQGQSNAKLMFDKVSKFKATACTPENAKIELDVTKSVDPVTKKDIYTNVPDGYDASKDDDKHACTDVAPGVSVSWSPGPGSNKYTITAIVTPGTFALTSVDLIIGGTVVQTITAPGPYTYVYTVPATATTTQTLSASVVDTGLYKQTSPGLSPIPAYD
jgi:penicillin-binding protein 1A